MKLRTGKLFAVALILVPLLFVITSHARAVDPIIPFAEEFNTPAASRSNVEEIIKDIIRWLYTIFFLTAVFFILLAAYNFIAGAGDENRLKKAKDQLKYAVIAIVIALVASGVSIVIKSFLSGAA